ncbi:MAG: 2'-5' RNA ligase family protein [Actinomycetota bacterium]|nr:2'-5' RNA ligase family protein [Actinomycetota bacterium]
MTGARATVGVVINLPEPHATVLRRWRERIGDPQAEAIPPHVTLLPPTPVDRAEVRSICRRLGEVAAANAPFPMHLSGTGTFRPLSQVVFVQVATGIAQCELLEAAIRRGPLGRPREFPFHPHVTVAHDLEDEALDDVYDALGAFVARFTVDRFTLFRRATGGAWVEEGQFPLGED